MKLYLVEAPVKNAERPYFTRAWVSSQNEAASTRKRFTQDLDVPRKDIRTSIVEVGTTRNELLPLLNKISNGHETYMYDGHDG